MNKKETYAQHILKSEVGVSVAEEEYVTDEHLQEYENFVTKVQKEYKLKNREEAQAKAQELIKAYHAKERQASEGRSL